MMHIWFNLLMIHSGQLFWLDSFESYDECIQIQIWHESQPDHKQDKFYCPSVGVEMT